MVLFSLQNSMKKFLKETISGKQFELTIDTQIFSKDIILKAAYNFLDKGYFFFSLDTDKNIILHEHVGMYAWHTKHHLVHIEMAKENIKAKGKRTK